MQRAWVTTAENPIVTLFVIELSLHSDGSYRTVLQSAINAGKIHKAGLYNVLTIDLNGGRMDGHQFRVEEIPHPRFRIAATVS